jgi:predicted nuclease of predicted toxin-antitoxin system
MGARGRVVNLLVDENLPQSIVDLAKNQGIEAVWVRDEMPAAPDAEILKRLRATGETLVTRDVRFANHVLDQIATGSPLGGVVLVREQKMSDIQLAWQRWLENPRAPRGIAVLTTRNIRFREYPQAGDQTE